jgi:flagellin-like hook-associated protein FlgL
MAIKKMDSQAFNGILSDTQDKILTMNNGIAEIKDDMTTKLKVINHEIEYLNKSIDKLTNATPQDGNYILLDNNNHGLYSTYCNNIHPYFKKDPVNVFNVTPINSKDVYFKDEAKVSINGVENDFYKNILKEDTVSSKKIFFEEYTKDTIISTDTNGTSYLSGTNTINLTVLIDQQKAYGINKFNMIEIDPYLMKSFNIKAINIYSSNTATPAYTVSSIAGAGKTRIILDKKYMFYKVEFIIEPKYTVLVNEKEVIPFGLKHVYFYEVDFRSDSYIDLVYESEEYLDYVNNKVVMYTPTGSIESTLTEQGITIYLDNVNGILGTTLEPTENVRKTISRNLKKIYFRVPIGQSNSSISSTSTIYAIKFFIESR